MTEYVIKLTAFGRREKKSAPGFGSVKSDKVAAFTGLKGRAIRCTTGYLWVTLEQDPMDHVVRPGQAFTVPTDGKVVIGGKGGYAIEQGAPLAKAS